MAPVLFLFLMVAFDETQVDGPGTKQIPICTQGQLTKINRTISEPPNRHLLVWYDI